MPKRTAKGSIAKSQKKRAVSPPAKPQKYEIQEVFDSKEQSQVPENTMDTHTLLLDLAGRRLEVPESLDEIKRAIPAERARNSSLALEIARAAGNPDKNEDLLEELRRQKAHSDKRIDALERHRSRTAFLEGWSETMPAKPRRQRSTRRTLGLREKVIRKAIRAGKIGVEYAIYLDEQKIPTPEKWRNNKENPCPKTHQDAYQDFYWREMIQKEKSRVSARM